MRRSRNGCRKEENEDERSSLVPRRRRKTEPYAPLRYEAETRQLPHRRRREVKFISERR